MSEGSNKFTMRDENCDDDTRKAGEIIDVVHQKDQFYAKKLLPLPNEIYIRNSSRSLRLKGDKLKLKLHNNLKFNSYSRFEYPNIQIFIGNQQIDRKSHRSLNLCQSIDTFIQKHEGEETRLGNTPRFPLCLFPKHRVSFQKRRYRGTFRHPLSTPRDPTIEISALSRLSLSLSLSLGSK